MVSSTTSIIDIRVNRAGRTHQHSPCFATDLLKTLAVLGLGLVQFGARVTFITGA